LPLKPSVYAELLGKKIDQHNVRVWLVNTGWTGGAYGTGERMKLSYTRAMLKAAIDGELDDVPTEKHTLFGLEMPSHCPAVPSHILNPRNTWANGTAYDAQAQKLAQMFKDNFEDFKADVGKDILDAGPK